MRRLLDLQHPFFRPPWRRWLTVGACLGWGGLELYLDNPTWAAVFWAIGAYCAWEFRFGPPPREPEEKKEK